MFSFVKGNPVIFPRKIITGLGVENLCARILPLKPKRSFFVFLLRHLFDEYI